MWRSLSSRATARSLAPLRRGLAFGSETSALVVQRDSIGEGMASVQLSSQPVNSLTPALVKEITETVVALEEDEDVRGFVLGSAVSGTFSAGLDLKSLLVGQDGDTQPLAEYWTSVQEMWLALYTTRLATVAAISGHSPAAGCMLALSCDARVMVEGKFGIGLNETAFGLVPPPWFSRLFMDVVGKRQAELMLTRGLLLRPEEALQAGLVDAVVPLASLTGEATTRLAELLAVPDAARAHVKRQLREEAASRLREAQSEDLDGFMELTTSAAVQIGLKGYLESLGKKE